ncbi:SGNH/GDSL hydrolase family protein [Micromonospora sp. KC606]|uniref:SGNH/GDSL hydrolase family protein n=1 Tax=Micromonospora sp. KC606 TaxID=2530379 RepID=UPI001046FFBF|nr:SGNH/GDSL hydrolase family protein [Micromonospora sp. KC606]TDC85521.1 SGNH/GDSL hydrolase family protein [Micromonospora sp. KC606]
MEETQPPSRIGVWDHRPADDRYVRSAGDLPNWGDRTDFGRRPDGRRILLLGESVARGLCYEPVITPAKLLEQALRGSASEGIEVVDLALSGARISDVREVAASARHLEPDLVVVFAGNNWKYELSEWAPTEARARDARALEGGGLQAVLRQRENALTELAVGFVEQICALFENVASVVFVLPERNLLDWHPAPLAPVLGGGAELSWCRLLDEARAFARAGDWDGVLGAATALHDLDGGLSDEGFRLRAEAHRFRGDLTEALANYRRAFDVRLWCDGIDPSWLPSAGAAGARKAVADRGAQLVDLTTLLPTYAASGIPDRSLFYDFCHLNGRGLLLAATEIAHGIAPLVGVTVTRETCAARLTPPDPRTEAGAAFCAGFVNADFAQPEETLTHFARTAAAADAEIVTAMAAYCSAPATSVPWWMRTIEVPGFPAAQRFLRGIGRTGRYVHDDALVEAFMSQLRTVGVTAPAEPAVSPERVLAGGVRTNLLDPIFAPAWRPLDWEGILPTLPGRPTGYRHYFRAHTEVSTFSFGLDAARPVQLQIVARLGSPGSGTLRVRVNGADAGDLELADEWRPLGITVGPPDVRAGRNRIEIRWCRTEIRTPPFVTTAHRLEQGLGQELSVVYGELHSVHAWVPADEASTADR